MAEVSSERPSILRVQYTFRVKPEDVPRLYAAWQQIVDAHIAAEHGALGSVFLQDVEADERCVAISRWQSYHHWKTNNTEDIAPEAFEVFNEVCEVESVQVFREWEEKR